MRSDAVVAVITGASSGIGKALAIWHARGGAILGLLGRNSHRLEEVAGICSKLGATVRIGALDVRDRSETEAWLTDFDSRTPISLLIANAGIVAGRSDGGVLETASASLSVMDVNVVGVLNCIHPVLPRMVARRSGQIAIVSSLAAFFPLADLPSYSASKAALLNYGLALRSALGPSGISVSVVCPGFVQTPLFGQQVGKKHFVVSPELAAESIARGLRRNRAIIAFPFLLAAAARIGGLLPSRVRLWTMPRFTVRTERRT